MPVVFMDSFDHYVDADINRKYTLGGEGGGGAVANAANRHGVNGMAFAGVPGGTPEFLTYGIAKFRVIGQVGSGQPAEVGFGFAFRFNSTFNDPNDHQLCSIDFFSGQKKKYYLRVTSGGALELRQRNDTLDSWSLAGFTSIATFTTDVDGNTLTLANGSWYYLEAYFGYPNDNTENHYDVQIDGIRLGTATAASGLGSPGQASQGNRFRIFHQAEDTHIDDLYCFETSSGPGERFLGPIRIDALLPNGLGTVNDAWNPSPVAAHHTLIDDAYDGVSLVDTITANLAAPQIDDWDMAPASTTEQRWKVLQVNALLTHGASNTTHVRCFAIDDNSGGGNAVPLEDHYLTVANSLGSTEYVMTSNPTSYYRWLVGPGDVPALSRDIEPNWQRMILGLEKTLDIGSNQNALVCSHFAVEIALPLTATPDSANVRMTQLAVLALVPSPPSEDTLDQTSGPVWIGCTAHDNGGHGFNGGQTFVRCMSYDNTGDGFKDPINIIGGVAYSNANGVTITHGKPATLLSVACVNNSLPFNFVGTASTTIPYVHMVNCSHKTGETRITNPAARDAIVYDIDAITLSADPFVSGGTGDFALTGKAGDQIKNIAGTPFFEFETTTSYHDHQAAQHKCPTGGSTENLFTDTQTNRSVH